jgi:hypothetical protein
MDRVEPPTPALTMERSSGFGAEVAAVSIEANFGDPAFCSDANLGYGERRPFLRHAHANIFQAGATMKSAVDAK